MVPDACEQSGSSVLQGPEAQRWWAWGKAWRQAGCPSGHSLKAGLSPWFLSSPLRSPVLANCLTILGAWLFSGRSGRHLEEPRTLPVLATCSVAQVLSGRGPEAT